MNKKEEIINSVELFFPYYINQSRLLDIYAIINGGLSEYEEVSVMHSKSNNNTVKGEASASAGFKIFKIAGDVDASSEKGNSTNEESSIKKVQTVTSILSIVIESLKNKNRLKNVTESNPGSFVLIPVNLRINSVKKMFEELNEILDLIEFARKSGAQIDFTYNKNRFKSITNSIKSIFNGQELFFENDDYTIFGNIYDEYLYQATYDDIIDSKLMCLAQVKRVFPEGTELMRNTVFNKVKDKSIKSQFADIMNSFNNEAFDFESTAVLSVEDKPVYQIEIIALYQTENM
jgi:hypothetical protein